MTKKYDLIKIYLVKMQQNKKHLSIYFLTLLHPIVYAQQHCRYNLLYPFPNAIDCVPICIVNDTPSSAPHQLKLIL